MHTFGCHGNDRICSLCVAPNNVTTLSARARERARPQIVQCKCINAWRKRENILLACVGVSKRDFPRARIEYEKNRAFYAHVHSLFF